MASRTYARTLLAASVMPAILLAPSPVADAQGTRLCCFSNWRYSGTCVVQIGKDQQCGDILSMINNPMDVSTYCSGGAAPGFGGTNIRGGWTTVDCGGDHRSGSETGGTRPPERLDDPQAPSLVPDAKPPAIATPDPNAQRQRAVPARQPTFIKPVEPTTVESEGPTVITLR
jgi:hypothetical protein